jgi:uncharacterized membrane protein
MSSHPLQEHGSRWALPAFIVLQVLVMLVAISGESFWIDEFWSAHFAGLPTFGDWVDLVSIPSGSQTPLHFLHMFLWGRVFELSEWALRMANLPLFVLGQVCLYLALRPYPRAFSALLLTISALHPVVWQYADEARQYMLMYTGSEMILAYLLHLHGQREAWGRGRQTVSPGFTAVFIAGGLLLFGASLLGAFWVLSAGLYTAYLHHRHYDWRYLTRGITGAGLLFFLVCTAGLSAYYLQSILQGAGGSRLATTTPASLAFAGYELLGLSGLGPGRNDLRDDGIRALKPYASVLAVAAGLLLAAAALGLRSARQRFGGWHWAVVVALVVFPVAVVVLSGFLMHWRVVGRHLLGTLPVVNLVLALGLYSLWAVPGRAAKLRRALAVSVVLVLAVSALSLRFAERHRKDDYHSAADLAKAALAQGERVWWAADFVGAVFYRVPGSFDYMGELTGDHRPPACQDLPGAQAVANLPPDCLAGLSPPDLVLLTKPETFDRTGAIAAVLATGGYTLVQALPAFEVWRLPPSQTAPPAATQ